MAIQERTGRTDGNPIGLITVVAFNDFLCPVCKAAAPDLAIAVQEDGDVRVEYRDLSFFGPLAERAALLGMAVERQNLYAEYHHNMMAMREPPGAAAVRRIVENIGGDWEMTLIELARNRTAFMQRLNEDTTLAYELGISGTPSLLIGSTLVLGRMSRSELQSTFEIEKIAHRKVQNDLIINHGSLGVKTPLK
jgi:protein-disulfide isomerase